jgi:hypothetical protein
MAIVAKVDDEGDAGGMDRAIIRGSKFKLSVGGPYEDAFEYTFAAKSQ